MGRLALVVDGVAADDAGLGKLGRSALAYLVLERHRPVSRDELADALWGEDLPATWEAALRGVVSRVRATLTGAGIGVGSQFGCYQLSVPAGVSVTVDVERVAAAVEEAQRDLSASPDRALAGAANVVDVTGAVFLPGSSGHWVERRQADLAALHLRALEVVSAAASACGDHGRAVAAAKQAVDRAPLRESAHQRLMAAHFRAGDRAAALAAYERCRAALADELGVSPSPQTDRLYVRLLGDEAEPGPAPSNLPASRTSFVGRTEQLDELHALLDTTRLLTLTGPGGVGKSRLALRLAEQASATHPDGTWLVELAPLTDEGIVAHQVLAVLGVPEPPGGHVTEALGAHLAARRLLLVLDNCEHLAAACAALVDALLRAAPHLRVVATSREPVGVHGETTWTVPPLSRAEAEQLLRDRVAAAAPGVDLTGPGPASEIAAICARLDGIPLAIELAGARARVLSLAEITRRLDDRLRLLVGGPRAGPERHQTLRATIDWSYSALAAGERALFARLSVFAGGFGLAAAERVCGNAGEAGVDLVETLGALVEKSLVTVDREAGAVRYRLLETLRQYGAERLGEAGDGDAARDRHLDWAVALAEEAEPGLEGAAQGELLSILDDEHDNLRIALDWATQRGRVDEGLRLGSSLMRFWEIRGHLGQGRRRLVALASRPEGSAELRAKSLNAAAVLAQRHADVGTARTLYQEALVIRRALGDRLGIATALHGLANLAVGDDDLVTARALFEENLAIARELGKDRMEAASLMNLGVVAQFSFMHGLREMDDAGPEARSHYQASLDRYRALGDRFGEALALENLGALERFLTGPDVARTYHEQSIAIRRGLGDKLGIAASARYLVPLVMQTGETASARQFAEERLAIERDLGNIAQVAEVLADLAQIASYDDDLARARHLLGESRAIYERFGDRRGIGRVSAALSNIERRLGNLDEAQRLLDVYRSVAVDTDNRHGVAWCCIGDARLARSRSCPRDALDLARAALARAEEDAIVGVEAAALDLIAWAALEAGDALAAARLMGAAEALRGPGDGPSDPERATDVARARAAVGDGPFESARAEGRALSPGERRRLARS
ncbi:MAG: BTAD domain-containing putative transcriptional regulator [Acidimicrobiales bacterium]